MSIITSPSSSPSLSRATRSRVHNKRRTVFTDESTAMLNLVAGESVLSQTEKVDKAFGMLQRSGNSHPKLKSHIRKFFRKLEDELEENIYKSQEEYAALNWSPVNDPDKVLESPVDPEKPGSDFAKYTTICRYPNRSDFSVHDIFLLRSVALDRLIQLLCHPFRSCEGIEKAFFLTYILELRGSAILGSIVRLVETFQKCKEPFILSLWYQKTSLFLINWMALHWEDWVDLVNEPDFSQYKSLVQQGIETFLGRKIVPTEDDAAVEEGNLKPSWSRVVALANPPDTLQRDVELSLFSVEEAVDSGGVGVSSIARFLEQNILKAKRRLCASSKAFENLLRKYNDLNQLSLSPDSPSLNQPKSTTPTLGSKNFFRRQKTNEQLNVPCSRCGQEFVGIKRCATCKNEYCHPCAKLPMLKNACNDGNRHTFHDPESREIKRLGSLKNPLSSSIASSVLSASSPPIPKPCVVCQGSGMMCTNCGDYFCWKCSQLAAFKNMCSHQFEGPIKKNCKRCGEEDAPVQCIVCDFTYCVTCSRLPPLQNICTTGSRHNFIGEEKEMEVKECVAACSRCGQEGVGEMKTCTQCNNKYCLRCALLPVFKNNCSKGPKHTFADAPSPPLSPDLRTKKPQGEKKVPPGKPSRPSRPPPRPCSPLLSGSRPPNDGTPLSPERKSCPNPTSPSLPPFPPLDNHLASPDMGPRFSIDSFTPSSPNETPLPQPLSHARPPSPLGIGEPVANPQSPPLQSKRCGKCGKRKENILNYCESCELDFCGECSKLPDVRNVCSKGGNHAFGEEEKEKENSDSDLVAACSFCTSERNLRQCLICSNIVCALCVGTTTIKCLPGKKHNYVVRSRSGSRTRSLGICDTAVGLILGEDETDENECSRCGTSVNVRECLVCQSFYCPSCSLLAGFKNMCTNGSKHSFGSMNAKPEILIVNDELNCCSRCGEEHKNAVKCLKCQDYYCSKCSLLSASRNVCPNGAKHTFEEENKKGDEKKEEGNSGWIVRRTSTGGQAEKKVFRENQNSSFSAVSSGGEDSPRSSFLTQRGRSGTKSPENQSTITKPSTPSQLPNSRIPKSSLREGDGNSSVHKRLVHSPQRATIGSSPSSPVSPSSPMTSASPSSPLSSLSSSPSSLSVTPSPSSNMNMALKGMAFLSDPHLRKTGESDQFPRFRSEQMLKTIDTKHLSCCRCLRVASICCTICDRVFCDTCKVLPLLKENCISGECHSFPNEPPPDVRVKFKSGKIVGASFKCLRTLRSKKIVFTLLKKRAEGDISSTKISFDKIDNDHFAMQLSLLHWIMMDQIPVREHIHWIGSKDKKNCCPKLSALVEHFNWLSNWIVFEVVTQIRLEERVKLCERIIHILMKLVRSRNFFGAMALVGALRSAPVYRMKKTLSSIDESWRIKYDEVCQILPVTNQPTTYRRVVAEVPASSSVPYLGVLSKDLLFTHDGNTAFCGEDKALFNWNSKFAKIAEMIFTHREQMGGIYDVDADERLLSFLVSEIPQLSIDDAFSWSRRSEPKDSEVMIGELIQIERELTQEITEAGKKAENDAKEIERLKEELKEKDEIIGQLKAKLGES